MDGEKMDKKSGCIEPESYCETLRGKRKWFKLPIETKCIWIRCNKETKITEYNIVKIVDDIKGDWLIGDYAFVNYDNEMCRASYGWLFKIYT